MANSKGEFLTWLQYIQKHSVPAPHEDLPGYMRAHTDWVVEYNPNVAGGDADRPPEITISRATWEQLKKYLS